MMKTTGEISAMKIAVFFAAFFAFFLFFAPSAQAACSPPYSGNFVHYGTFSACIDAGRNYCISDGSGGAYGYDSTNVGTACTSSANACGATNGTCNEQGSCDPPAVPYTVGDYCASPENACGNINEGEITNACTGACSVGTPATPYTVGATCTSAANNCGATNSGTITNACTGACSASAPANVPNLGTACNRNVCGGTGVLQCDAAGTGSECSTAAPTIPVNYGNNCSACNNVGECNSGTIACDGNCSASAPADKTLTASLAANPTSGTTSTDFIMTATLGGTATGSITLQLFCDGVNPSTVQVTTDTNPYTFGTPCEYSAAGTYTPKVNVTRQALSTSATTSITVAVSDPTAPTITSTAPSTNAFINAQKVSYTLSELVSSSSIIFTRSGGIADNNSPHTCALQGTALNTGAHTNLVLATNANVCANWANPLVSGAVYTVTFNATDPAGNPAAMVTNTSVTYDIANPTVSYVDPTPLPGSWSSPPFTVYVSGADTGGSNLAVCSFKVFDNSQESQAGSFTCTGPSFTSKSFEVTGCSTAGENKCAVTVYIFDNAGNVITTTRLFSINPVLTYPSNTWQRLWYWTSGASPSFDPGNYKGEDLTQTAISFDKNYGLGVLPDGGQSYARADGIGFKSSSRINFLTTGTYRFTINSDDGVRLYIDESQIPLSGNHESWQNKGIGSGIYTADVNLSTTGYHKFQLDYYEDTGSARVSFAYELLSCDMSDTIPKSGDDIPASVTVPVVTATGTKQSPVMISHYGADSDLGGVIYKFLLHNEAFPGNARVQMDDKPLGVGDCDNDLTWDTSWGDPPETEYNFSTLAQWQSIAYSGAHTLSYGFQIFTDTPSGRTSVIKDTAVLECFSSGPSCSPTFLDDRSFNILKPIESDGVTGVSSFGWKFNLVECTSNAHCTVGNVNANSDANENKQICNLPTTNNSPNFSQNTCIDSVPPTSKIKKIEDDYPPPLGPHPPGFAPNIPPITGAHSAFLNADNNGDVKKLWYVFVEDTDNSGGSGLDSCFISINGFTLPRVCNDWTSPFSVGRSSAGAIHCTEEGNDKCKIKVWAQDKAGNKNDAAVLERKVYDETTSPPRLDERKYNDFTAYPDGFNVFWLGVDWTAPTAQ